MSAIPYPLTDKELARFRCCEGTEDLDLCKRWRLEPDHDGYGRLKLRGAMHFAHRVAYTIAHGPIPEGMVVAHRCDVRNCTAVAHLFATDQGGNNADRHAKGRDARGEILLRAKRMPPEQRAELLALSEQGVSRTQLSLRFGIGRRAVRRLLARAA